MINADKPLGQVAYEAYQGSAAEQHPWRHVSYPERIVWDRVATAVAIALHREQTPQEKTS
jgi:hypothetical protein